MYTGYLLSWDIFHNNMSAFAILKTSENTEVRRVKLDVRASQQDSVGREEVVSRCLSARGNLLEIHLGD